MLKPRIWWKCLTSIPEKLKDEKGNERKPSSSGAMDNVAITADEQTNSLVITADQSVQEKLATVIARAGHSPCTGAG